MLIAALSHSAYAALLRALATGNEADFDAIPLGVPAGQPREPLTNPQAGLSYESIGLDPAATYSPPAPQFASAWAAGEAVELYWMAVMRDVAFADYGTNAGSDARAGFPAGLTAAALQGLNALSDFRGPRVGGLVTVQTLFRAAYPGVLNGPFVSQFFWLPVPFGACVRASVRKVK